MSQGISRGLKDFTSGTEGASCDGYGDTCPDSCGDDDDALMHNSIAGYRQSLTVNLLSFFFSSSFLFGIFLSSLPHGIFKDKKELRTL